MHCSINQILFINRYYNFIVINSINMNIINMMYTQKKNKNSTQVN